MSGFGCVVDTVTLYKNTKTMNNNGGETDQTSNSSIRRASSADMSSPKWLQNNGFMTRTHSSGRLFDEEDSNKNKLWCGTNDVSNNGDEKRGAFEDIWSSILSQKKSPDHACGFGLGSGEVGYVHPLVKRSASSLSEKSLEICTESLGSETGSDGFSFHEPEDSDRESADSAIVEDQPEEEVRNEPNEEVIGLGHVGLCVPPSPSPGPGVGLGLGPKPTRSSFPPPLRSLAHQNGSNLHMRSHRQGGRLVLEAVSIPSQNCFKAQRHGGRLLLTLVKDDHDESYNDHPIHEEEGVSNNNDQEIEFRDENKQEQDFKNDDKEDEVTNVHMSTSSTLIKSKLIRLTSTRNNSPWRRNINATVIKDLDDQTEDNSILKEKSPTTKSLLPPRPRMTRRIHAHESSNTPTTNVLNAYEYYWRRTRPMAILKPLVGQQNLCVAPQAEKVSNNSKLLLGHNINERSKSGDQALGEVVVVKATGRRNQKEKEAEYLVPILKGCKKPKRSLLFWEPYCIATS